MVDFMAETVIGFQRSADREQREANRRNMESGLRVQNAFEITLCDKASGKAMRLSGGMGSINQDIEKWVPINWHL